MQTKKILIGLLVICLAIIYLTVGLRPGNKHTIKVNIAPHHTGWVYKTGDTVKFNVSVTKNGELLPNVKIFYEVGPEMMPPVKRDIMTLKKGEAVIDAGTMTTPGFLRCYVSARYKGKNYQSMATAAVGTEDIQPTTTLPDDFVQFWDNAKSELANIPLDAQMTLLSESCTEKINVYHVSFQNIQNTKIYGILCIPKAQGKYPAILKVPGSGVRPYYGDIVNAEKGVITLEIGIHGIPVNMKPEVYEEMEKGILNNYWIHDLDNKDRYYYRRVYLGCLRSVDFIFSLPEFDGENIVISGFSQGGALAIVTAALDNRIKGLVSNSPALCDLTGYLNGRAGGWPPVFNDPTHTTPEKKETSKYYDVVNFARYLKVPGFYSWGFNDDVCPPTSMYAAYNVIQAPRTLYVIKEIEHWYNTEQTAKATEWMFNLFKQ